MADFSALKQSIQNYIKQNGNKEITGYLLQNILLSMVTTMGDGAINDNASDISDIKSDIQNINGDITNINGNITNLNGDLSDEVNRAKGAETTTVLFSDGKLVFKNAAGTVLYQLSVDSFLSAITTRLNTGALYAGYATPNTTPTAQLGQKLFYIATQAGTYTNFLSNGDIQIVIAKDGIYILNGGVEADDWTLETVQAIDDEPTAGSNNLVDSGGVYRNEKNIEISIKENVLYDAFIGENIMSGGYDPSDTTRCLVELRDISNITSVSSSEEYDICIYGTDDGIDGQQTFERTWGREYVIPANFGFSGIIVKLAHHEDDSIVFTESEIKNILTVTTKNSLESEIRAIASEISLDGKINSVQDGNYVIPFDSGEVNPSSGITPDNTRGNYLCKVGNIFKIIAKAGYKICGYYNTVDSYIGSTYFKAWTDIIDLSDYKYPYIAIGLRKNTETDVISENELKDAAFMEIDSVYTNRQKIGITEGNSYVNFISGDFQNLETGLILSDSTRGYVVLNAAGLKKVSAVQGFKICGYSNNYPSVAGSTFSFVWSDEISLENYAYNYIILKVMHDDEYAELSKEDLQFSVIASFEDNRNYPFCTNDFVGNQLTDNDNFYYLNSHLLHGKKYKIVISFEGFVDADFSLENGSFITYNINQGKIDEVPFSIFNSGKGIYKDKENVLYYIPTSGSADVCYFRLSSLVKAQFEGDYTQKVHLKSYTTDNEINFVEKKDAFGKESSVNVYGDILPSLFKGKLESMTADILIACVGDSLTGTVDWSGEQENPTHEAPGHQMTDWVSNLLSRINKNKPQYDRLDSVRNGSDVFTKTGAWNITDYDTFGGDDIHFGDFSISSLTFRSSDSNAQIQFSWDLDSNDKCNIIVTKSIDAVLSQIIISEGNGKVLISEDRANWVEANGFTFLQRSNPTGMTNNELAAIGEAKYERHRRLWMKKAGGVTGTVTVTYKRDNSTLYNDSYLYFWGIERYSNPAIFVDNIGRGGRPTIVLNKNTSDIFDRHPDLVIYEMPLANEMDHAYDVLQERYNKYFLGDDDASFKTKSNNYSDVPVLIVLPHGRASYFDDDNRCIYYSAQNMDNPPAYIVYKQIFGWLKVQMSGISNARFINLLDYMIDEGITNFGLINKAFGGKVAYGYTADGIHLSKFGSEKYVKYLAPIFYV